MIKLVGSRKVLLVATLAFALCGCGKQSEDAVNNTDNTVDITEDVIIQESQAEQDYPMIAFIENASYYGTDEICGMVPRKAPDGVIDTFVDAAIMPDVNGVANFGADQGQVEYMFVEDGRLIIHIGEDWYYFEKNGENTAIQNPQGEFETITVEN